METTVLLLERAAHVIDLIGICILLYAASIAFCRFLICEVSNPLVGNQVHRESIRRDLGGRILFALELMIASDLIETVLGRTQEDLLFLAMLVAIRTTISFFLGREIAELREHSA